MEDTARLALIEMHVKNDNDFESLLKELLQLIKHILDNPHDRDYRKLKSDVLKPLLKCEDFCAYLKYIGFEMEKDEYVFPPEQTLSKLKAAQAAIEKKIIYCYGPQKTHSSTVMRPPKKTCPLKPANILTTDNKFLQSIQKVFNDVLRYEDEELQELARKHIPLTKLQLYALDRMRTHQRKIKTGEVKSEDMSFEMALLAELLSWFKHEFFKWVDQPECPSCGGDTRFKGSVTRVVDGESCRVEEYKCKSCAAGKALFPRHNEPRTLLRTRRGRCGEFANCFTLLCRALGYDTRYVFDTADHVWCEVFDYDTNSWVHVDPCEPRMNAPLLYAHGWKTRLAYVIGVSRDDLQDVTWRYTTQHKEVLKRRTLCSEHELLDAILRLRAHRQAPVSAARRRYLAARTLRELVQLQLERTPKEYESEGRLSGSLEWRQQRGEAADQGHVFHFHTPGTHAVSYCTSADQYTVAAEGQAERRLPLWGAAAWASRRVFRKVEPDWRQAYLVRQEGETSGSVAWKFSSGAKQLWFQALSVRASSRLFETGRVDWTLQFDDHEPKPVKIGDSPTQYNCRFKSVVLTATLSGGEGEQAWQHAQLFRQPLDSEDPTFQLQLQAVREDDIDLD